MKRSLLAVVTAALLAACASPESAEEVDASNADATDCTADANQYGHDACKKKLQPTDRERSLSCPVASTQADGFVTSGAAPDVDVHAFDDVAPFDAKHPVRVVGIIIRRVNGVPHYQYLSNGHHDEVIQPWSSSKWIGVLAAGGTLRTKSNGNVGLTSSVGGRPVGDLITDIETYQSRVSSSNGLARWFKNVAGRDVAQSLIVDWLGRSGEEFRGGYGTDLASPGFTFKDASGASITVSPDDRSGITNLLSMMTEAEALKRLAVWDDEATRVPNLEAEDVQTVLYGATQSVAYKGEAGGGMQRDLSIFMQNALDMKKVEQDSHGKWRIFSKLGDGVGTRPVLGDVSEIANVAYACLPVLDAAGQPTPDQGAEFVVAIHTTNRSVRANDQALNALYERVVNEVMLPRAQPR